MTLREIPNVEHLVKTSKDFRACCNFLESLGYPLTLNWFYSDSNWWRFYATYRSKEFYQTTHSYQVMLSLFDYGRINSCSYEESVKSATSKVSSKLRSILSLLAIENFYEVLEKKILDLKMELDLPLARQVKGEISLKRMEGAISKMVTLNGLYFQNLKIWSGIDEKFLWDYTSKGLSNIAREKQGEEDLGLLQEDIKYRINKVKASCESQLNLLRLSYEQILSYKTTTINYNLQNATFWLSIAVTLLTIVTVIPEDMRTALMLSTWLRLQNLWQLIKN